MLPIGDRIELGVELLVFVLLVVSFVRLFHSPALKAKEKQWVLEWMWRLATWGQHGYPYSNHFQPSTRTQGQGSGRDRSRGQDAPYKKLEHDSEERRAWLAAQQRCFQAHMDALKSRRYFRSRMRKYQKGESFESPFQLNNSIYFYFKKARRDQRHYVLYCTPNVRQQGVPLLNANVESVSGQVGAELAVAGTWVSEDCRKLAYALVAGCAAGATLTVRVRDVESRKDSFVDEIFFSAVVDDGAGGVCGLSVAWVHRKHKGFFYTRWASSVHRGSSCSNGRRGRVQELCFHRLHSAQTDDVVVFRGAHAAHTHVLTVSQDDTFLVVEVYEDGMGSDAAELASFSDRGNQLIVFDISAFDFRDLGRIGPGLLLADSFAHRWEYVASMGRELWLRTNLHARSFRVVRVFVAPAKDVEREAAAASLLSAEGMDPSWPPLSSAPSSKRPPLPVVSRPIVLKSAPSPSSSSFSSSSSAPTPPVLVECIPASPRGHVLESAQLAAQSVLVLKYMNLHDGCHEVQLFDLAEAITLMAQAAVAADIAQAQRHVVDGVAGGLTLGDAALPLPLPIRGPSGLGCAPDALAGDFADALLGSLGSLGAGGGAESIDVVDNLTGDVSGIKDREDAHDDEARRRCFAPLLLPVASLPHPPLGSISGPACSPTSCDIFYRFSSFSEPCSVYRASIRRHETDRDIELSFDQVYSSNNRAVDSMQYDTKKEFYFGHDGRQIAIYIFGAKRAFARGPRPCVLHVRDSFGSPMLPQFSAPAFLFTKHFEGLFCSVDLCAAATSALPKSGAPARPADPHMRRPAHAGTAEDVALAAEYLLGVGAYCQPGKLALLAESNGSVASAACVNRRPDLFAAAAFDCGMFDLLRYHIMEPVPAAGNALRSSAAGASAAKAWQEEKTDAGDTDTLDTGDGDGEGDDENDDEEDEEDDESWRRHAWYPDLGCSEESAQDFRRMRDLSPLHNVPGSGASSSSSSSSPSGNAADKYPAVLLIARTRAAVPPAHSFKYIAALQHAVGMRRRRNQRRPLLLKVIDDDAETAAASSVVVASGGAATADDVFSPVSSQPPPPPLTVSQTTAADVSAIAAARCEAGHAADIFCFLADGLGLEWVSPSAAVADAADGAS